MEDIEVIEVCLPIGDLNTPTNLISYGTDVYQPYLHDPAHPLSGWRVKMPPHVAQTFIHNNGFYLPMADTLILRTEEGMTSWAMPDRKPFSVGLAGANWPGPTPKEKDVIVDVPTVYVENGQRISSEDAMRACGAIPVDRETFDLLPPEAAMGEELDRLDKEELEHLRETMATHAADMQAQQSRFMAEMTRKDGQIRLLEEKVALLEKPPAPPEPKATKAAAADKA